MGGDIDIDRLIGNICVNAGFNVMRNRVDKRSVDTIRVEFGCVR